MQMDEDTLRLIKKCEEMAGDPNIMAACRVMLKKMEEERIVVEDKPDQSYIEMAQQIAPEDVPLVLKMALEIRERGDIKDPEIKIAASRLIRAIEML